MGRIRPGVLHWFFSALLIFTFPEEPAAEETSGLAAFSDPARIWGSGIEGVIEESYRRYFKTFIISGKVMNLRMPFAQNNERDNLTKETWEFLGGGKADPAWLWEVISETLASEDFTRYAAELSDGREKVIIFDIPSQTWTVSRDLFDIARMKAGAYKGLPHRPYVLAGGGGIEESDVYNYLYCVSRLGIDCSGFVWQSLTFIAARRGLDLGRALSRALGLPRGGDPAFYAGTWFFGSRNSALIQVRDEIRSLRPGDILLFRGRDGSMAHSAIIQSIDFSAGLIRYLQSTDEAPLDERGAHESYIRFDPAHPEISLASPALTWTQNRYSPFPGEKPSAFSDDGQRYRAFSELGGGRVVRLRVLASP